MTEQSMIEKNQKEPNSSSEINQGGIDHEQSPEKFDLDAMIERIIEEKIRKRQQAEQLQEFSGDEASPDESVSSANDGQCDQFASDVGGDSLSDESNRSPEDAFTKDSEHGDDASEQAGFHGQVTDSQSVQSATPHPAMTPQEKSWWAMTFEELYQQARKKGFGKTGQEGRKSGRVRIIKWLCAKNGITPYVVPSVTPVVEDTTVIKRATVRATGAISHPEAILRTSDPALQLLINEAEKKYQKWPATQLLELAMQRSYQLLKDSKGKLPSKSISAMSNWLAAWDVLKSPREKNWWLGDGIVLVNRAKAMGYGGSSKKYDVILWLRSTPEESEAEVTELAEPTPNKRPEKRKAEDATMDVSKRPSKGSKRPHGWHLPQYM